MRKQDNFFTRITQIKPEETKGAIISFLFIFILMASYMIMKPVRDALPSDWGDISLATQWTYTFIVSTFAVFIYNICASFISIRKLVPAVFIFFAISFISIYTAYQSNLIQLPVLGKVFYVWSSVFSLFHISVFWSFISQQYNKEQSKRIFGFINTGASVGAIAGPSLVWLMKEHLNEINILIVTAIVLLLTLPLIAILNRDHDNDEKNTNSLKLNTNPFSGFIEFINHKRLIGIAAFIFFFTGVAAFLYFAQKELLSDYSRDERRALLSQLELYTNSLTILIGIFATNRIAKKFGMPTTLSIIPIIICALLLLISMNPVIFLVLALQLVRRSGNYAITRPAREILYTAVDKKARFKTKPIIDVVIYRGGDVFWAWIIAFLGDGYFNLGLGSMLCVGALVALLWGLIGIYIGKKHEEEQT